MSEESIETAVEPADYEPVPAVATAADSTGNPAVDGALASLEGIEDVPASEQTPIFEAAHEALRAALADAGNETEA